MLRRWRGADIISLGPYTTTISTSTIAYNQAHDVIGGVSVTAQSTNININNSTIVLNTAGSYTYTYNAHTYNAAAGVGIAVVGSAVALQSTIIANNSANGTQEDLSFGASGGPRLLPWNNLVRTYKTDVTLPSGQGNLHWRLPAARARPQQRRRHVHGGAAKRQPGDRCRQ